MKRKKNKRKLYKHVYHVSCFLDYDVGADSESQALSKAEDLLNKETKEIQDAKQIPSEVYGMEVKKIS